MQSAHNIARVRAFYILSDSGKTQKALASLKKLNWRNSRLVRRRKANEFFALKTLGDDLKRLALYLRQG